MGNSMTTSKKIPQTINTLFTQLKDVSDENKLRIFTGIADLLRYSATLGGTAHAVPIANFIAAAHAFPWEQLDFFATAELVNDDGTGPRTLAEHGVSEAARPALMLQVVQNFFELLEDGALTSSPELPQLELLSAAAANAAARAPAVPAPPVPVPEIFVHKHMARVFVPNPVTHELLERLGVAYGLYTDHGEHQIRALRFESSADDYFFILESGEVAITSRTDNADNFDEYTKPEDLARIPLTLLACTQLALADESFYKHLLSPAIIAEYSGAASWFAGCLGGFKHTVRLILSRADVEPIDALEKSDSMPAETSLQFPAHRSKLAFTENTSVTLTARRSTAGIGITSALTRTRPDGEVVLMRHDYPRQQVAGFYLFPLTDGLINVTVRM